MTASTSAGAVRRFSHHSESTGYVRASTVTLFAHVDDHARLSSHMSKSSWMMGGGRMDLELDEGRGQRIGSHIWLAGKVFGMRLSVEEVVIERNPPHRKVWETTNPPRLLVIGDYRMGFEITPATNGAQLRVFIDYSLSPTAPARWLGYLLGRYYAKWCTRRMVRDAIRHFSHPRRASALKPTSNPRPQRGLQSN